MLNKKNIIELRTITGAGISMCQQALLATKNNINDAIVWLREKGLGNVKKRLNNSASEGVISFIKDAEKVTLIEVNCESDFVARNIKFLELVQELNDLASSYNFSTVEEFLAMNYYSGGNIMSLISKYIAIIGENIILKRVKKIYISQGDNVVTYVHNKMKGFDNIGQIVTLILLSGNNINSVLSKSMKDLAMHIAASNVLSRTRSDLDPKLLEKEKNIIRKQIAQNNTSTFGEKILQGRLNKFFKEVVLEEQTFLIDGKTKIKDIFDRLKKENSIEFKMFVKFEIEKK